MKYSTNSLSNTHSFFTILRVKVVCKSSLPTQKEKKHFLSGGDLKIPNGEK